MERTVVEGDPSCHHRLEFGMDYGVRREGIALGSTTRKKMHEAGGTVNEVYPSYLEWQSEHVVCPPLEYIDRVILYD